MIRCSCGDLTVLLSEKFNLILVIYQSETVRVQVQLLGKTELQSLLVVEL